MKKQILCLTAAALLIITAFVGCTPKEDTNMPDGEITGNADQGAEGLSVCETKFCNLKYPDKWSAKVEIDEGDEYAVKFAMKDETPVFDLLFNTQTGAILGTIEGEETNTVIRVRNYTIDENDNRYNDFYAMTEDIVNVIIENLVDDYTFIIGEEIIKADNATFEIPTRLVTMFYPAKWENKADIAVSDTSVKFSFGEYKLFDLFFGSSEGYTLGTYNGETISIVSYDIDASAVSEEIYYQLCAMQEDVNVILQHLMEDEAFKIAN